MPEKKFYKPIHGLIKKVGFSNLRKLRERVILLEKENKKQNLDLNNLKTILNITNDGILAVDNNKKITNVNKSLIDILEIESDKIIGENLLKVLRHKGIHDIIDNTFKSKTPTDHEIHFSHAQNKILKISALPVLDEFHKQSPIACVLTIRDVTDIRKLEHMRTEFVSNVTHELKTPLTSIRGFIETLKDGAIDNPEVRGRFLDIIDIEAERLHSLINDILELSDIEHRLKDDYIENVYLKDLCEEVFFILQQQTTTKNITLTQNISSSIKVRANRNRIKQLILNLVDNAIKYNVQDGYVLVDATKKRGYITIKVEDSGIGITKENHQRIFERFYRVDKARSKQAGGTGLGLSIVKHIVNLYHGDIQIISEQNKGSKFIIQLPIR